MFVWCVDLCARAFFPLQFNASALLKNRSVHLSDASRTKRFVLEKYFKCLPLDARKCLKTICKICKTEGIKMQAINFISVCAIFFALAASFCMHFPFSCICFDRIRFFLFISFHFIGRTERIQLCSNSMSETDRESVNVPIWYHIHTYTYKSILNSGYLLVLFWFYLVHQTHTHTLNSSATIDWNCIVDGCRANAEHENTHAERNQTTKTNEPKK